MVSGFTLNTIPSSHPIQEKEQSVCRDSKPKEISADTPLHLQQHRLHHTYLDLAKGWQVAVPHMITPQPIHGMDTRR